MKFGKPLLDCPRLFWEPEDYDAYEKLLTEASHYYLLLATVGTTMKICLHGVQKANVF